MRLIPLCVLALVAPLGAQTLTTEVVASGFSRPVWVGSPPGDERIFVVEQNTGLIRIIDGSQTVLPTPFLDIDSKTSDGGERGLLGLAFHPKYEQNGFFFVNYTAAGSGDTVVERYQVSADPNVADASSALEIFRTGQPFANHNAGDLAFSPIDGYLYIPLGDGGDANDPGCRSQKTGVKGKVLRIDVDAQDAGLQYAIPTDNPFFGNPDYRDEVWSIGWRNPWRFSFDRLTGDMYVGDVGQFAREEINFEPAQTPGRNYGWPAMEGNNCIQSNYNNCINKGVDVPECFDAAYTDPVTTYSTISVGCSVVGGVVYRGCKLPALQGVYFYADWCSGSYWSLEIDGSGSATNVTSRTAELGATGNSPVDFGEDGQGEILIANRGNGSSGRITRIVAVTPPGIADCDANELDDDCEVATISWADTDDNGEVDACQSLSVASDTFCLSVGGQQDFSLHAGEAYAGELYLLLGSFAGTSPGLDFGPVNLPLNFDPYMNFTALQAGTGPLVDTVGVLDGTGGAAAAFVAGPGLPAAVAGLTANHAFLVFTGSGNATFASNPTALRFEL